MRKQEMFARDLSYAYKRTHPFSHDRMRFLENRVKQSKYTNKPYPQGFESKFGRMKAKIEAFTLRPHILERKYPDEDKSLEATYVRAILNHRQGYTKQALTNIDELISAHPRDPYFHELKGQILFESGQMEPAIQPYEKAISLLPNNGLLRVQLAQVLLENTSPKYAKRALHYLDQAQLTEADSSYLWRLYATAYGRLKKEGMMVLSLAEEALTFGDMTAAQNFSNKALKVLAAENGTAKQRAKDILDMSENY